MSPRRNIFCIVTVAAYIASILAPPNCKNCLLGKCDEEGICTDGCEPGFADKFCQNPCQETCLKGRCFVDNLTGKTVCTDGCMDGYCYPACKIPCPKGCLRCERMLCESCTLCEGHLYGHSCQHSCFDKCNGYACSIEGNCSVDKCMDGRYGTVCSKSCKPRYESCHQESGQCIKCRRGLVGDDCQYQCPSECLSMEEDTMLRCRTGCVLCELPPHTDAAYCQEDQHCSKCDRETEYCQTKCHDGYYGLRCSSKCSSQCKNNLCEMIGTAIGRCTEGCKPGFHGLTCDIPCLDPGICNQTSGKCSNGCGSNCSSSDCMTRENCDPSMVHRSTIPVDKAKGTTPGHVSPSDDADGRTSYVVMSTAVLVIAFGVAVVSVVRKFCKRRSNTTGARVVSPRRVQTSSVTYETLHRYWEISDDDVGASTAAVITSKDTANKTDNVMPALADVLGPDADEVTGQIKAPQDLVWNSFSYSDPRPLVRYLTPSDETRQLQRTASLDHLPMHPSSGTEDTSVYTI